MRKHKGDLRECMAMANATTRMLLYWEPVMMEDLGSADVYPSIINYAFSCELYLKALMIYRSPGSEFEGGHDLCKLFGALSEEDRGAMHQRYEERILDEDGNRRLWAKPFDVVLEELKLTYMDWRYAFEKNGLMANVSDLMILAQVIREYVCMVTGFYYGPVN